VGEILYAYGASITGTTSLLLCNEMVPAIF
jgi:hypothetical protein